MGVRLNNDLGYQGDTAKRTRTASLVVLVRDSMRGWPNTCEVVALPCIIQAFLMPLSWLGSLLDGRRGITDCWLRFLASSQRHYRAKPRHGTHVLLDDWTETRGLGSSP